MLVLDISYSMPKNYPHGRDLYLSLRGTTGVVSWSPSFGSLHEDLFVSADSGEFAAEGGRRIPLDLPETEGYAGAAGLAFLQDLARSLRDRSSPPVTGEDGLRALEVVEAIYQSANFGRAVAVARAE